MRLRASFWEAFWVARVWMRESCSGFFLLVSCCCFGLGDENYLVRPLLRESRSRSRWGRQRFVLDG